MSTSRAGPKQTLNEAPAVGDRPSPVVCIAEDRRSCECGLRLLIASIERHCSGTAIHLFSPSPSEDFINWLKKHPCVTLNGYRLEGPWRKYDVKPQILISLLEQGFEQVLWVDSDILVCSDFRPLLSALEPDVFVTTEEALCSAHSDPDGLRARLWGFKVGRTLPFSVNTGVIRAGQVHLGLLKRWQDFLAHPDYLAAQQRHWYERPPHMMGDQEVLTALLASADYAHVPVKFLTRGNDIVQYFGSTGYTVLERLRNLLCGMPLFFHSQGYKPWWSSSTSVGGTIADRFNRLYQEVTPYVLLASPYRAELESSEWLEARSPALRFLRILAFGKAPLLGLPLAVIADLVRAAKSVTGRLQMSEAKSGDLRVL